MTHNTEGGAESTELGVNMLMKLEMMCNTGDGDWEYGNGALKITANQGHNNQNRQVEEASPTVCINSIF